MLWDIATATMTQKRFIKMSMISKIGVSALALLVAAPAYADKVQATITDEYRYVSKRVPFQHTECYEVEVPVYANEQGDAAGGALMGMIIGGLLGKGASGNDQGAAAGAVIGGIIGADKAQKGSDKIVGYRLQEKCETKTLYENQNKSVYSHSIIKFKHDGKWYQLEFRK